jgi:hypothetical protein
MGVLLQEWLVICYNERDRLDPRSPETSHERFFPVYMAVMRKIITVFSPLCAATTLSRSPVEIRLVHR